MKAKDYLLQVSKIDKLIANKLIEKEQWLIIAQGTSGTAEGERVQSSGNQQKMADSVCKMIEIDEEINKYIDKLIDIKQDVIHTIEQLQPIEYDILHIVYIQFKDFNDVATKYNKSIKWVNRIHGRALANVQKVIDKMSLDVRVCPCLS